jgi:hypothetical protein
MGKEKAKQVECFRMPHFSVLLRKRQGEHTHEVKIAKDVFQFRSEEGLIPGLQYLGISSFPGNNITTIGLKK